ncbi:MAG TPA: lysophospholipid acyltransferase family protein [Thermoanaerobaculia bacterium]|nr:lysophospholipid acyltransferase family protein [Thermoanaerobaculia bacterium]
MTSLLRWLFFWLVVRPVILVVLGLNVRHRERLPDDGPAILVANHNSHLDTMVLMTLLPTRLLPKVRPVAAADYFLKGPLLSWFALRIIGILPVARGGGAKGKPALGEPAPDPLASAADALARGEIVILFPEGSRGEPERLAELKSGVWHLARRCPAAPVVPVFLHGLGKTLPRGAVLPVPFFCDVFVGEPVPLGDDKGAFLADLKARMQGLAAEGRLSVWE